MLHFGLANSPADTPMKAAVLSGAVEAPAASAKVSFALATHADRRLARAMQVRAFTPEDATCVAELYRDAARGLGAQAYSRAQVEAWASYPDDFAAFCQQLNRGVVFVSLDGNEIAAFGQLEPKDHIALLYTRTRFARRGHATAVYRRLEAAARAGDVLWLTTTASRLSQPLFAKEGFQVTAVERNVYKGVEFERCAMAKRLSSAG